METSPELGPVERLLLAEAPDDARSVLVIDGSPALLERCAERWPHATVYRDRCDVGPSIELTPETLAGVDLVLLVLPPSLGGLADYVERVAAWCNPGVRVVCAGRNKHMTPRQNDVLARHFTQVHASRGVGKCRALHASHPVDPPLPLRGPQALVEPCTGLELVAHGSTFAGARLDPGTRLLLSTAADWRAGDAVDVGSGNGVLAAVLARQGRTVTAVDVSRAAVASTAETLRRNGLDGRVTVLLADGIDSLPDRSAGLVVTNPPFHVGAAKDSTATLQLIQQSHRVLRDGGELWCVYNTHLPYLEAARRPFGRARIVVQDRGFIVLCASR